MSGRKNDECDKLLQVAEEKCYDFIRFTYTDIHGISRSKTVSKSGFRKFLRMGVGVHVGSIGFGLRGEYDPGVEVCERLEAAGYEPDGNVQAKPVSTLMSLPQPTGGGKHLVGQVLCETFHALTGQRQKELPRFIAKRQLDALRDLGYSLLSSLELEFVLVTPSTLEPVFDNPGDMFVNSVIERYDDVLMGIASHLESIGVAVETLQIENAQGQFELTLKPEMGIKAVDNAILAKDCIKSVARSFGYKAVFMTKYCENAAFCNSAHFNHSLKRGIFALWDVSGQDKLSDIFHHWMGGLIHHFPALGAICCPTFNCYRRLHRGPLKISLGDWGLDDRMAAFRVKNYSPESCYIESRIPSGSSNPYLILAATVAAGIDGLENKRQCPYPRAKYNPSKISTPNSPYHKLDAPKLADDLSEAMNALEADDVMTSALGKDFIKWFLLLKQDELKLLKECDISENNPDHYAAERNLFMELL